MRLAAYTRRALATILISGVVAGCGAATISDMSDSCVTDCVVEPPINSGSKSQSSSISSFVPRASATSVAQGDPVDFTIEVEVEGEGELQADIFFSSEKTVSCNTGTAIATGIHVTESMSVEWVTTNVQPGTYHVCVVFLKDGDVLSAHWIEQIFTIAPYCTGANLTKSLFSLEAGTPSDPYRICTAAQFAEIAANLSKYDAHYRIMADIDFAGESWIPIGTSADPFAGTIDGQGAELANLNINLPGSDYVGLIGAGRTATVKNLTIIDFTIIGRDYVGALGGQLGTVSNVTATNLNVQGAAYVGGILGHGDTVLAATAEGSITASGDQLGGLAGYLIKNMEDSRFSGSVNGATNEVGGLVGRKYGGCPDATTKYGHVLRSGSDAVVSGADSVGGLVGFLYANNCYGRIVESAFSGTVTGANKVGGLAGYATSGNAKIINSENTGSVTATGISVGGIVGEMSGGGVTTSFSNATISSAGGNVGGLVGKGNGVIFKSYALGTAAGLDKVGGLAGDFEFGKLYFSYSKVAVSGRNHVGGLAGMLGRLGLYPSYFSYADPDSITSTGSYVGGVAGTLQGQLHHVYATSAASIATGATRGGLVGHNSGGLIANSLWNSESTGVAVMCGSNTGGSGCNNSYGYNNANMQAAAVYQAIDWDMAGLGDGPSDIWYLPPGGEAQLFWQTTEPDLSGRFAGGNGTKTNPYLVSTLSQLESIGYNPYLMTKSFAIANDMNVSGFTNLIGHVAEPFRGTIDGQGHDLAGFDYNDATLDYVGLIRIADYDILALEDTITSPTVKNLSMSAVTVTGRDYVGALVGSFNHYYGLSDITVAGTVNGRDTVGLVAGANKSYFGTENLTASGAVNGRGSVGGVCGFGCRGSNIVSHATVSGTGSYVGGIVGLMSNSGPLVDSYATGDVGGASFVGGVAGEARYIINSYAEGGVSGTSSVGGLAGSLATAGTIQNSYASGNVLGTGIRVGGLIGEVSNSGNIMGCYATGSVDGQSYVGGLVGEGNLATLTFSYSSGTVSGENYVGGLAGHYSAGSWDGPIENSYSTSAVIGKDNPPGDQILGGLVGGGDSATFGIQHSYFAGTVTSGAGVPGVQAVGGAIGRANIAVLDGVFWDVDLNLGLADIGIDDIAVASNFDDPNIFATSTANMTEATHSLMMAEGWDFVNAWNHDLDMTNAGYPELNPYVAP